MSESCPKCGIAPKRDASFCHGCGLYLAPVVEFQYFTILRHRKVMGWRFSRIGAALMVTGYIALQASVFLPRSLHIYAIPAAPMIGGVGVVMVMLAFLLYRHKCPACNRSISLSDRQKGAKTAGDIYCKSCGLRLNEEIPVPCDEPLLREAGKDGECCIVCGESLDAIQGFCHACGANNGAVSNDRSFAWQKRNRPDSLVSCRGCGRGARPFQEFCKRCGIFDPANNGVGL